jgi:integrase
MKSRGTHRKTGRGANGSGTVRKIGNIWYALFSVVDATGKKSRICRTTGETNEAAARKKLAQWADDFATKNAVSRKDEDRQALTERLAEKTAAIEKQIEKARKEHEAAIEALPALALDFAWEAYRRSQARPDTGERTLADYESYYYALADWMTAHYPGMKELRQITRTEAEAFAAELRETRSAGTFNKRIVFFRHFWKILADDSGKDPLAKDPAALPAKLVINPWEKIQKRAANTHSRRELTVDELGRVLADLTGEMRLLFAIGIYTGLRLGDCALLEWGAIDLVRGRIALIPRKTARHANGKPVIIPIHPSLGAILAETEPQARTGYVLPEIAKAYNREPAIITNRIQKHFEACGIKTKTEQGAGRKALTDVGFHSLRHTFVSLSANAGTPIQVVQAIVGHSNPAMTRHYFHESETALTNAVAALPDVIATDTSDTDTPLDSFKAAFLALPKETRQAAAAWAAQNIKTGK